MCRNIKNLFNFDPPATEAEIRDASIQFVRKISGFTNPSKANENAFERGGRSCSISENTHTVARYHGCAARSRNGVRESAGSVRGAVWDKPIPGPRSGDFGDDACGRGIQVSPASLSPIVFKMGPTRAMLRRRGQ